MKKIVVTPAGREIYLKILFKNLIKCKNEFDFWDLWINTTNEKDIKFMENLALKNNFIRLKYLTVPWNHNLSIYSFFKNYKDPQEIYLRLDDDIVYIQKGSIQKIFNERIKDDKSFLLYGNIVNNAILSHIHQRTGNIDYSEGICGYACMDPVGWKNPKFAELAHRSFLNKISKKSEDEFKIKNWNLHYYERVSINAISWTGKCFAEFDGVVSRDEEQWLSVEKPKELSRPNKIIGDTLFSHYAFHTQRAYLETTDILSLYDKII